MFPAQNTSSQTHEVACALSHPADKSDGRRARSDLQAYDTLKDQHKRLLYDLKLREHENAPLGPDGPSAANDFTWNGFRRAHAFALSPPIPSRMSSQ